MVDDRQIAAVLAQEAEPEAACRRLVDLANAAGGRDNVTAIVARFENA
jgi:protein phosphatase